MEPTPVQDEIERRPIRWWHRLLGGFLGSASLGLLCLLGAIALGFGLPWVAGLSVAGAGAGAVLGIAFPSTGRGLDPGWQDRALGACGGIIACGLGALAIVVLSGHTVGFVPLVGALLGAVLGALCPRVFGVLLDLFSSF